MTIYTEFTVLMSELRTGFFLSSKVLYINHKIYMSLDLNSESVSLFLISYCFDLPIKHVHHDLTFYICAFHSDTTRNLPCFSWTGVRAKSRPHLSSLTQYSQKEVEIFNIHMKWQKSRMGRNYLWDSKVE